MLPWQGVEDEQGCEGERVLGSVVGLWHRYVGCEAAMLLHRTCLMVDYQACNRALDKAKPNRKEAVSVIDSYNCTFYCRLMFFRDICSVVTVINLKLKK